MSFNRSNSDFDRCNNCPEIISERCQKSSALWVALASDVKLVMPRRASFTKFGVRAFCEAGKPAWNSLPKHIRLTPTLDSFKWQLKICVQHTSFAWLLQSSLVLFTVCRYISYQNYHRHQNNGSTAGHLSRTSCTLTALI